MSHEASDPFELLLQISHEGICLLDAAGVCRGISSIGSQQLGYLPRELKGRVFHDVVHSTSGERIEECRLCGLSMEEFRGDELLRRKDGTALEASCTARAVVLSAEGFNGRLITFTQAPRVLGKRIGEEAGEAPEAKLRRAVAELAAEKQRTESAHAFARRLFLTPLGDLDRVLVDQFCAFTDSKLGLLYKLGEPDGDFVLAGSHSLFASGVAHRISPGQGTLGSALSARYPLVEDHAGSPIELAGQRIPHVMYVPLWDGEDDLGILILARTVPRPYSKQEQEAVAHLAGLASVALANSRLVGRLERLSQHTRAALDGIVEAIRLVDSRGRELLVNESMRQLDTELGLELHGSLYGPESTEFAARTTDPDGYLAELSEMQSDPERCSRTEWELADSGRIFERYTAPIRDSLGTLIGRVLVLREMTAERGAERLQAELISVVSHELRTPLTSMLGFANVLLDDDPDESEWSAHVETIRSEIVRLLSIVDDLLDFQRVAEGGFGLDRDRFDLHDLIDEQTSAHTNASPIHQLVFEPEHDRLVIEADRDRIAQVLSNLLSNAIKYSPEGGPVRVTTERKDDRIRVSISDTGLGIPMAQQDKVFTRFFRVESEETAHIRGLGLGLALSKELVAAHGGRIGFDSAAGAGTVFWFELPTA